MKKRLLNKAFLFYCFLLIQQQGFSQRGAISGTVYDDLTQKPLLGVNVLLENKYKGTTTDENGIFLIRDVPAGKYVITVSYIGYQSDTLSVNFKANKTLKLEFKLKLKSYLMKSVTVSDKRGKYEKKSLSIQIGTDILSPRYIETIPIVGEPDVIRAIQSLPGVTTPNDISNEIHMRGGNTDQNLVLYDGAVIYNPYHLWGLASIFNTDIIDEVQISNGGFSAAYGDRLSSVISVKTKSASSRLKSKGNLSLLTSRISLTGKLTDRIYFNTGFRRTYYEALNVIGFDIPYYFYDFNAKLSFIPNNNNLIYFSAFFSKDQFLNKEKSAPRPFSAFSSESYIEKTKDGFWWDNLAVVIGWEKMFNPQISSGIYLSQSSAFNTSINEYEAELFEGNPSVYQPVVDELNRLNAADRSPVDNILIDRTAKATLNWEMNNGSQWLLGVSYSNVHFDYSWNNYDPEFSNDIQLFIDQAPDTFNFRNDYSYTAFFIENLWELHPRWLLRFGIRTEFRGTDQSTIFDPRLNLRFHLTEHSDLKLAVGKYHQGLATAREEGLVSAIDLVFPIASPLNVSASTQALFGWDWNNNQMALSMESYYKKFNGLLKSGEDSQYFEQISGNAYGVELQASKRIGSLKGKLFYMFSSTKRGQGFDAYYTNFDQRHRFQFLGNYQLGRGWEFNFKWVFATGQPFTPRAFDSIINTLLIDPATGRPTYNRCQQASAHPKPGTLRYPLYHRLDIGFVKNLKFRQWALHPYLQILNTYYRKNPLFYDGFEEDGGGFSESDCHILNRKIVALPIIPTLGIRFEL